ncbi:MAG: hypothetical protein Q3993_03435 [Filifactor alocis]|nr:hypothetical protein [Filifactor alocis]
MTKDKAEIVAKLQACMAMRSKSHIRKRGSPGRYRTKLQRSVTVVL